MSATGDSNTPEVRGLRRDVGRSFVLFRFHRLEKAGAAVNAAKRRLDGSPALRALKETRRAGPALVALGSCFSMALPAPLAALTVQVTGVDGHDRRRATVRSAGAGVYIRVEGIPVGRTLQDGTLTTEVPSGIIDVSAIVPPNAFGRETVRIAPGATRAVTIGLDNTKEPSDETDLALLELHDGELSANTSSVTLRFATNEQPFPVTRIEAVELQDSDGNVKRDLTSMFIRSGTSIVAVNAPELLNALLRDSNGQSIRISVLAVGSEGFNHDGAVEFRIRTSDRDRRPRPR